MINTIHKPSTIEWLYLAGGVFLTRHYAWIKDDASIYFRYIDNFLFLDIGLVYNQGEFVEGFSSPFWLLLLTLFRTMRINYWVIISSLACICFILFWFMLVQLNRELSPEGSTVNFPLAYLAFNYGVLSHFSSGLETPVVQIVAVGYALYILNPSSLSLQILLAVSPLIRHELAIPLIICLFWTWIYHRKFPLKLILLTVALVGSWIAFRIYYYADLFPNTFYLKDIVDIKQGVMYLKDTINPYHLFLITGVFCLMILILKKIPSDKVQLDISKRLVMVLTAIPVALYVIKIGGAPIHYRYLAFPFCLIACSFSGIFEHIIGDV